MMEDIIIKHDFEDFNIAVSVGFRYTQRIYVIQQPEIRKNIIEVYGPAKARELAAALNKAADELERQE